MEALPDASLYERPEFLTPLKPIAKFVNENSALYQGAQGNAEIGIYLNRASAISDYQNLIASVQGLLQILLRNKIPFTFIDNDQVDRLKELKTLVIPDVNLVSDQQLNMLTDFQETGSLIITGKSCRYDEFFRER